MTAYYALAALAVIAVAIPLARKRKWTKVEKTDNGYIERSDEDPPKFRLSSTDNGL